MEIAVFDHKGETVKKTTVSSDLFDMPINTALLHEVLTAYQASLHTGTASTKTRAQVSGGGAKPWRQKGTGRARAGTNRSPLWRKGGVIFGPHPRSYAKQIPQKKKIQALFQALTDKVKTGALHFIDMQGMFSAQEQPKTKKIVALLKRMKLDDKHVLIVMDKKDELFCRAARNISQVHIISVAQLHAYAVLVPDIVLMTEEAYTYLENKFSAGVS